MTPPDLGRPAADFSLGGVDGRDWTLNTARGPRGLLVMFLCNHCPYVKAAITRINRDVAELRGHGIGAIAIMPNDTDAYPEDDFENMKRFSADHRLGFPYVLDATQTVARAYGAVSTPEFFGFDHELRLRYHGRIDAGGMRGAPGARRELFEAMVLVGQTGQGPAEQHPGIGCSIKWKRA